LAGFPQSPRQTSIPRKLRQLAAAALLTPALAFGQADLPAQLQQIREAMRYVPDDALRQLQALEPQARASGVSTRAEFLMLYSNSLQATGDVQRGLAVADELIAYGRQQRDDRALAKGLLARSYALYQLADLKGAHAAAFEAERVGLRTKDMPLHVHVLITAGQSYQEDGNYPAALGKLQEAVETARRIQGNRLPLASALNALVFLYVNMRQFDKGWELQQESVAVAKSINSPGRVADALSMEYALGIESNQPERARRALVEGLAVERKLGARQMIATTLVNLADSYLKEHDYARALDYSNQSLKAAIEVRSINDIATSRINLGQAYLGLGRIAEGKQQFEAGLVEYDKAGDKPELQAVLMEYGGALERAGDYKGAVEAYHRERTLTNEMFAKQRQKDVLELQQKYDTEKKQRQIEALRQENRVKGAELDNRRLQQRIWWLMAVVSALVTAIVGLLYRKVRTANAQLEEKNEELKQQSSLDPLTSLYNRRHFQEFMRGHATVERRVIGDDTVGALFLMDVDHFKHVNDTYGHAAGDAVLRMIAENLRVALRETDMIVRWGGEEFLAFLPAVSRQSVDDVARRILYTISSQSLQYQGITIPVNVSVGFAPFPLVPGDTPLSWERAVNLVDMALYLAKAHGRNRAYGVRGFANFGQTTMESIEQDLERAWRNGFVDLSVVLGGPHGAPPPAENCGTSNVVQLKAGRKSKQR
jgi:diguanylate cyclase (GGDEF)-like protein